MTTEQKDYTDLRVIKDAIKEGMAPFNPNEINIRLTSDHLTGNVKVDVQVETLPEMIAKFTIDYANLVRSDSGEMLKGLGHKFFNFFRQYRTDPETNVELGDN